MTQEYTFDHVEVYVAPGLPDLSVYGHIVYAQDAIDARSVLQDQMMAHGWIVTRASSARDTKQPLQPVQVSNSLSSRP